MRALDWRQPYFVSMPDGDALAGRVITDVALIVIIGPCYLCGIIGTLVRLRNGENAYNMLAIMNCLAIAN